MSSCIIFDYDISILSVWALTLSMFIFHYGDHWALSHFSWWWALSMLIFHDGELFLSQRRWWALSIEHYSLWWVFFTFLATTIIWNHCVKRRNFSQDFWHRELSVYILVSLFMIKNFGTGNCWFSFSVIILDHFAFSLLCQN